MKVSSSKYNNSPAGTVFDIFNYIFLAAFTVTAILPFIYIIAGSFADSLEFKTRPFFLIPQRVNLDAYRFIFSSNTLMRSILVTIYVTLLGTLINLLFTLSMAYPLSKKDLPGRNLILNMVIFSMLFGGGMIPTYLIIKSLYMIDTFWALTVPGAISAGNLIVIKTFFQDMPVEIEEAALIDGSSYMQVLTKIVLPLSMPVIATFSLFYAVGHWNNFFSALIYINDAEKWPLQVILRQIILLSQGTLGDTSQLDPTFVQPPEEGMKMAVIVVATIPILMVYPFLQKHFTKGVMIGAIKG